MPSMDSSLSIPYNNINSTEAFIATYTAANDAGKKHLFSALKLSWAGSIKTPNQFGHLISCLEYHHICELYHAVANVNPFFLRNAAEFAHICTYLDTNKIKMFCNFIEPRLNTRSFIDNAKEFCTIFCSFQSDDGQINFRLTTRQLDTICEILKPKFTIPTFFVTLDDFIKLFCLMPTLEGKTDLFVIIQNQLDNLVRAENNIHDIHQNLNSENGVEFALFKRVREEIYRSFINDHTRLEKALHATLFLILDNYPGKQMDKLKLLIEAVFSDQSVTELNLLLEKVENEMRFLGVNITSTRLQNAITHLISNLKTDEKVINVDRIIQLAKSKLPIYALFSEESMEPMAHTHAPTYHPEF